MEVLRVISQHICDLILEKGPTHATSANIVRVGAVFSQHICEEGTMEAMSDDDVMDDASEAKTICTPEKHMRACSMQELRQRVGGDTAGIRKSNLASTFAERDREAGLTPAT